MATLTVNSFSFEDRYNWMNAQNGLAELIHHKTRGITGRCKVVIWDADHKNSLDFTFTAMHDESINAYQLLITLCWQIAYNARGNVRKLVEDHRVLMLFKELDLSDITHYSSKREKFTTMWTDEDGYAQM